MVIPTNSAFEFADGTIEMWIRPTYNSVSYQPTIIGNQTGGANVRWSYHINQNRTHLTAYNGSPGVTWNYNFNQNEWYHIAFVEQGTTTTAYINGVSQGSRIYGSSGTTGLPLRIGSSGGGEYFIGDIDEVRVWSRALSECEIQEGMNCELSGTEAGLKAYYPFNQGLAGQANGGETSLEDATGNGHDGTLINFTLTGTASNWVETGGVTTGTACPNIAAACPSLVEIAPTSKIDNINQPILIGNEVPINFQVSPNPFINQTQLSFDLPKAETISIQVFDRTGRLVEEVLSMEKRAAGSYQIMLSDDNLYNGLFYIILQTPTERVVKKVIAIKDGRGRNNDDD